MIRKQAAAMLNISTSALDRLRKSGEIGFVPVGERVMHTEQHVEIYIARFEQPATSLRPIVRRAAK